MKSHGDGLPPWEFRVRGADVVFETGALVFHPENITLGDRIYVGHYAILKGYYVNEMIIGSGTWIGQNCFFHAAGGLYIGENVGIGPGVKILTSSHDLDPKHTGPILHRPVEFSAVHIGDGSDLGVNAIILPGVELGRNVQVGAGAVVTKSFPDNSVVAGVPAKALRTL